MAVSRELERLAEKDGDPLRLASDIFVQQERLSELLSLHCEFKNFPRTWKKQFTVLSRLSGMRVIGDRKRALGFDIRLCVPDDYESLRRKERVRLIAEICNEARSLATMVREFVAADILKFHQGDASQAVLWTNDNLPTDSEKLRNTFSFKRALAQSKASRPARSKRAAKEKELGTETIRGRKLATLNKHETQAIRMKEEGKKPKDIDSKMRARGAEVIFKGEVVIWPVGHTSRILERTKDRERKRKMSKTDLSSE